MTPDEKEKMRWQFAGIALAEVIKQRDQHYGNEDTKEIECAVDAVCYADELIAELEKTAPKDEVMEKANEIIKANLTPRPDMDIDGFESFLHPQNAGIIKLSPEPRLTPFIHEDAASAFSCTHRWVTTGEAHQCVKCGALSD